MPWYGDKRASPLYYKNGQGIYLIGELEEGQAAGVVPQGALPFQAISIRAVSCPSACWYRMISRPQDMASRSVINHLVSAHVFLLRSLSFYSKGAKKGDPTSRCSLFALSG